MNRKEKPVDSFSLLIMEEAQTVVIPTIPWKFQTPSFRIQVECMFLLNDIVLVSSENMAENSTEIEDSDETQ